MKVNLLYSIKSLIKNRTLSILSILCMICSVLILVATTNIQGVSSELYDQEIINLFGDYDVLLKTNNESDSNFGSTSDIEELEEHYDEVITFFGSFGTLNGKHIDIMVCDNDVLSSLTGVEYDSYGYGDIVLSKSFAKELGVKINSKVNINHFGYEGSLYVSQIVDDVSIFSNANEVPKIVISHRTMRMFMPFYNQYLFNTALFKTSSDQLIEVLSNKFDNFTVSNIKTSDVYDIVLEEIEILALLVGVPTIFLCVLILYTILTYFNKNNSREINKLIKLGQNKSNVKIILFIQGVLLSFICALLSILLIFIVLYGINSFYYINYMLSVSNWLFILFFIFIVPFVLNLIIYYKKDVEIKIRYLIITAVVILLFMLIDIDKLIYLKINLLLLLVFLIPNILKKCINYLKVNNISFKILKLEKCSLLPILTLSLIFVYASANYYFIYEQSFLKISQKQDITITNLPSKHDYKELFSDYDSNFIYQKDDLYIDDEFVYNLYAVSNVEDIKKIFSFEVDELLNGEIILSSYYKEVCGYEIGDEISLELNNRISNLKISGFIESKISYSRFIFVNIETLSNYHNVKNYNKIVIKDSSSKIEEIKEILDTNDIYSRVFVGEDFKSEVFSKNQTLLVLVYFFVCTIICIEIVFVLILRYKDIEKDTYVLKSIGFNNNKLIINDILIMFVKLIISILSFLIIFLIYCNLFVQMFNISGIYYVYKFVIDLNFFSLNYLILFIITYSSTTFLYYRTKFGR